MPTRKLKEFLDENGVKYLAMQHSPAFTAQEIAASAHVPGKELAKTVIVRLDGELVMCVLPALERVDLNQLKDTAGAHSAALAAESDFKDLFPGCEVGAMPPFGNLYDMKVFVSESLLEDEEIAFNAGSHRELIRLRYKDFDRLVKPTVMHFAMV